MARAFNTHKLSAMIAALLCSPSAFAQIVTGTVNNPSGKPIAQAKVHFHGQASFVLTDDAGQFQLDVDKAGQLHISKDNFINTRIDVNPQSSALNVVLSPASIETIVVNASGLHSSSLEMASPVTVMTGEDLKRHSKVTLGDTLATQPGVQSSYFGPVSASPVIRGMDGPRVRVLQNGLEVGDVSRVGPDHAVASDSLTAEQIEILRGPATLMYGSGAIGGVVNVVDNRIPEQQLSGLEGGFSSQYDSVNNGNNYGVTLSGGDAGINLHLDASKRSADNTKTADYWRLHPGEDEAELSTEVENSQSDSHVINLGTSFTNDHLVIGVAYQQLRNQYGIPAHGHHDHEEVAEPDTAHEGEVLPYADAQLDRWQSLVEYNAHHPWLESIRLRSSVTDYQHGEIEGGVVGTTFYNESSEHRLELEYHPNQWHGVMGLHLQKSDYQAQGEEAFSPDSTSKQFALFNLSERHFGDHKLEVGARLEHNSITTPNVVDNQTKIDFSKTAWSASLGYIIPVTEGYNFAVNLSHAARVPSSAELLAHGLHIGTGSYELGLQYQLNQDGSTTLSDRDLTLEKANNLDLSLRKFSGDLGFTFNVFYNRINDYFYQQRSAWYFDADEGHFSLGQNEHGDALPVYQYVQQDAELYGVEFAGKWQLADAWSLDVFADSMRGKLTSGDNLPRMSPSRIGAELNYSAESWSAQMQTIKYFAQHNISIDETNTDGYQLVNANINYYLSLNNIDLTLYLNVDNLTNELGLVHTSFIKDITPIAGRNVAIGLRGYF